MNFDLSFFITSFLLGAGLSMDAFSVSLVSGLSEPCMNKRRMSLVAGTFAFFQALMPMIGWILVHTVLEIFQSAERFIPVVALVILSYIGLKMIIDGKKQNDDEVECKKITTSALLIQGIATSIDALSVGLEIAAYSIIQALVSAGIIAAVTFVICFLGIILGKKTGTIFSSKATIVGGIILISIGVEIFITSIIG